MNAAEAMTRLIASADAHLKTLSPEHHEVEELKIAAAVCTAMLNTFLPIARFRAAVEVSGDRVRRTPGKAKIAVTSDYTACSPTMDGIRSSLAALSTIDTDVRVSIWEQRADGADFLTGYQGQSMTQNYRRFLEGLSALETLPTVQ